MRISYTTIVKISFVILAAFIFGNLNGVITMMSGIKAPTSPIILLFSTIIVYLGVFKLGISLKSKYLYLYLGTLFAYLFVGTCSVLWTNGIMVHEKVSLYDDVYRKYIASFITITAFYVGTKLLLKDQENSSILKLLAPYFIFSVLAVVLGSYLGLYDAFDFGKFDVHDENRSTGLYSNPNEAGVAANYTIVILIANFIRAKNKLFYIPFLGVAMLAAVMSFSKAAIIVMFLLFAVYLVWSLIYIRRNSFVNNFVFGIIAVLLFIVVNYLFINFDNIYNQLTVGQQLRVRSTIALANGEINEKTTSERSLLFERGMKLVKERPLIGNGVSSFHRLNDGGIELGVHNTYLMLLGEAGIFIFLLFVFTLLYIGFNGLILGIPRYSFFVIGIMLVYILNVCGSGHTGLSNRTSNAVMGITIAILGVRKINRGTEPKIYQLDNAA